ncbi:MAG: flagellar biosynthesis anti-sigma factor FlgM [Pseudomonadota bacterium]
MKIGNPADKPAHSTATHGVPNSHASANGIAHARGTRATAAPVAPTEPPATTPVTTPPLSEPSATLELSNTAATLLTSGATAEFDAEKVARISKAIEDGTFQINPEAIADKLIANAQEVLTKVQA